MLARVLPRFTLLAVLALVTHALPVPGAMAPEVTLEANVDADAGALSVRVTGDEDARVTLVVTHEDPLLGTVVDRVVPGVNVTREAASGITVTGLRAAGNFSVTALPEGVALDTVSDASALPALVDVNALTALARATSTGPPLASGDRDLAWFPVADYDGAQPWRVLGTHDGLVVVAWTAARGDDDTLTTFALRVAMSRDGGRSFGAPVDVSVNVTNSVYAWEAAVTPDGDVVFAFNEQEWTATSAHALGNTRLARFDPRANVVESSHELTARVTGPAHVAALPDGALLAAGRVTEPAPALAVWRVPADGDAVEVARLGHVGRTDSGLGLRLHATSTGVAGLVWEGAGDGAMKWLNAAWSRDGGRSWSDAVPVANATDYPAGAQLWDVGMDDAGTLHVTGHLLLDESQHAWYARVPFEGEPAARPVSGPREDAVDPASVESDMPLVAVAGARVWLVWDDLVPTPAGGWSTTWRAAESVTNGVTFGAPYSLRVRDPGHVSSVGDASVLYDGRLVLAGLVHDGDSGTLHLAAMPLFDPFADVSRALLDRVMPPASNASEPERTEPSDSGDADHGQEPVPVDDTDGNTDEGKAQAARPRLLLAGAVTVRDADALAGRVATVRVTNAGTAAATDVRVTVPDVPDGVRVTGVTPAVVTVPAGGDVAFDVALSGAPGAGGVVPVHVTTGDGAEAFRTSVHVTWPAAAGAAPLDADAAGSGNGSSGRVTPLVPAPVAVLVVGAVAVAVHARRRRTGTETH